LSAKSKPSAVPQIRVQAVYLGFAPADEINVPIQTREQDNWLKAHASGRQVQSALGIEQE